MPTRDIHSAVPADDTIQNGSIVVNSTSPFITSDNGAIRNNTSYANQTIPEMADISGKWKNRFDDPTFYS